VTASRPPGSLWASAPASRPGHFSRGLAHVAAPAAFPCTRVFFKPQIPWSPVCARIIKGNVPDVADVIGFVTMRSRKRVTQVTSARISHCKGTVPMSVIWKDFRQTHDLPDVSSVGGLSDAQQHPSSLEAWPMPAITALWIIGLLAAAAGFLCVMWWVTA